VNLFVAGFIGSPAMNLIPAKLSSQEGDVAVSFGTTRLAVPPRVLERRPRLADFAGRPVTVGVRPEDFAPAERGDGLANVTVDRVESLGSELVAYLDGGVGEPLTARLERRATLEPGQQTQLAVDLNRLYFFDAESGEAI
jgi:ABC-type sugar transport system ATPase subunit